MNYGITKEELAVVTARDTFCVYCGKLFSTDPENRKDRATIEHLNHRADWYSVQSYHEEGKPVPEIITLCCGSCNSSRGSKPLLEWFRSEYCINNDISYETVTEVVRRYINKYEKQ